MLIVFDDCVMNDCCCVCCFVDVECVVGVGVVCYDVLCIDVIGCVICCCVDLDDF